MSADMQPPIDKPQFRIKESGTDHESVKVPSLAQSLLPAALRFKLAGTQQGTGPEHCCASLPTGKEPEALKTTAVRLANLRRKSNTADS